MSKDQIQSKLAELHSELETLENVDGELRELLRTVDGDIHALLDAEQHDAEVASELMERVEAVGADFAARHPHLERFFQELVAVLGRLGI